MSSDYQVAAINLLYLHEAEQAINALAAAGIRTVLLKGGAFLLTVYDTLSDRSMSDIDLLVRGEDLVPARRALEQAGFRYRPNPVTPYNPFDVDVASEKAYYGPHGTLVELHWRLVSTEWIRHLVFIDEAAVWRRVRPLPEGTLPACQLSPEDTLIHICQHLSAHRYMHAAGFQDIRRVIEAYSPFPWEAFLALAAEYRMKPACYFALATAAGRLGADVPDQVLAALRPPLWQRRLVRWIADPDQGYRGEIQAYRERGYGLQLALAEQGADVIALIAWLLFPGPTWLREHYHLESAPQAGLACLWHPFVVLSRGFASLRAVFFERSRVPA